ncbi:sulfurtransferase complex subunit TusC [Motiliproteus sp. SC1-56]|uniref:sulfurtransferase complex subunit TusC n=1 Tax=Motiliproteus sp. SC1-56 TaxID=2799565 RepID=UPI001A8FB579|nr:sulfurtransferase complex subunit TusC [Motiliproteus sp. SC1-56]
MQEADKSLLVVVRHGPYQGQLAREALDAVLTAAAFEQPVSLLFMDDGVFQLTPNQDGSAIDAKNLATMLAVLPMYDVDRVYVELDSLNLRAISPESLTLPATPVGGHALRDLFVNNAHLLSF